jgi:hypothetical protein
MALSKHVTYYGTWSGFQYCNLTTPYRPPLETLMSSVGLSPGNLHLYPAMQIKIVKPTKPIT